MRSVLPSGTDFATKSAPIWPLAPGRFSTITGCPQIAASLGSMRRASVSAPPPGGNGTTMRTGFDGNTCARAVADARSRTAPASERIFLPRPEHALIAGDSTYALVDKSLHALALVGLGRIEFALGVCCDAVHAVELAGLAAAVAEIADLLERLAHDDPHLLVLAVGEKHEALLRIFREGDVPGRARSEGLLGIEPFLHELAVRLEYLHAVALAVAHVDQAVVRALDAVHRVAELLRRRRLRVVVAHGGVVGLVAVRTPIALHLAGIGVDHGDALVEIAVGDVRLVGLGVDPDLGHPPEVLRIVAAGVLAVAAELHQELPFLGELQDVGVLRSVAAEPHVALVVDMHAVRAFGPLVARPRAAPGSHQVAGLIEHQYRRGRAAALGDGRILLEPLFVDMQPSGAAMDDPDVVLIVDPHADGPAEQPVIRQRLGPQRIDFEHRRLDRRSRGRGPVFQESLAGSEHGQGRHERRTDYEIAPSLPASPLLPPLAVSCAAAMPDAREILVHLLRALPLAALALATPSGAQAHEIPTDVMVGAFVKPEGQRLRLLVRVPLKAMREVDFPRRGPGTLDLTRADASLKNAATLWIAGN